MADIWRIYIVFAFSEIGSYLDYRIPCLLLEMGWTCLFKETCQSPRGPVTHRQQQLCFFCAFGSQKCLWSQLFSWPAKCHTAILNIALCPVLCIWACCMWGFTGKQRIFKKHLPSKNTLHVAVALRWVSWEALPPLCRHKALLMGPGAAAPQPRIIMGN